jgi:hypothetical protein
LFLALKGGFEMTLDEAIKHAEEVAYQKDLESGFDTDNERYAMTDSERTNCKKCANEHRQLAEWLKDYKRLLEQQPSEDCVSRTQALKELKESAEHHANDSREEVLLRRDRDIIRALPLVTPTHGICKDCENWDKDIKQCDNMCWCKVHKGFYSANYFCADFEKRGSEE